MGTWTCARQCLQRPEHGCFPPLIFYFLRRGVSVTILRLIRLTRWAGHLGSGMSVFTPCPTKVPRSLSKAWAFHIHSGDPNSGPHDCAADTKRTKPSPQPQMVHSTPFTETSSGRSRLQSTTQDPRVINFIGTEQIEVQTSKFVPSGVRACAQDTQTPDKSQVQ